MINLLTSDNMRCFILTVMNYFCQDHFNTIELERLQLKRKRWRSVDQGPSDRQHLFLPATQEISLFPSNILSPFISSFFSISNMKGEGLEVIEWGGVLFYRVRKHSAPPGGKKKKHGLSVGQGPVSMRKTGPDRLPVGDEEAER